MKTTFLSRLSATRAPAPTILIRIVVGGIFLTEGVQKFLYPADLRAGRFAKIRIPAPEMMGPFVGGIEIACGALLIVGLLTRIAAILLLIDISMAIVSTKIFRLYDGENRSAKVSSAVACS